MLIYPPCNIKSLYRQKILIRKEVDMELSKYGLNSYLFSFPKRFHLKCSKIYINIINNALNKNNYIADNKMISGYENLIEFFSRNYPLLPSNNLWLVCITEKKDIMNILGGISNIHESIGIHPSTLYSWQKKGFPFKKFSKFKYMLDCFIKDYNVRFIKISDNNLTNLKPLNDEDLKKFLFEEL